MNEEADKKNIASDNTVTPAPLKNANSVSFSAVVVIIAAIAIIVIGGLYFYSNRTKTGEQPIISEQKQEQKQSSIPDDLIFLKGFQNTGREWPPKETDRLAEHNQNPLTRLRQSYCERVGYKYADFGGNCFFYGYFDSYKTYTDNEVGFTVYYPRFWQADLEPLNYGFTADPKVSLKRQGASCNIVYSLVDENKILSFSNASTSKISFGNQASGGVVSDTKGLNKITLPFGRELTNEEKAAGYTNSKLIAVPHFPYATSKFGFLLTSGDKQPLVEACVQEFDSTLNGRAINYPSAKLSDQSNGILSIQDVSSWFESYAHIPQKITLLFENSATGKEESIVPEAFSGVQQISDPFLSGGKLFYTKVLGNNPVIKTIDILTGENKTVSLTYDATKPIHSFFVEGDVLYYLAGTFCNAYLAKCKDLNLKSYNIKSGISENLASGITARDIDGFNTVGDALILRWSDGDAGCGWGSYQSFTLSTKALKDLGSYSYCEGDTDDSYTKFKNLVAGSGSFNYLVVKNGKIFSPSGTDSYPRIYIRVNTTEYPKDQ